MTEYAPHSKDTNPLLHVKFKHFEQRLRCLMSHNCCDAGLRFIQSHPRFSRFLRLFFFGPTSYEIYTYITRVDHDYTYVNQYSCLNGL